MQVSTSNPEEFHLITLVQSCLVLSIISIYEESRRVIRLVSNNGSLFVAREFQDFMIANSTGHQKTPPYHPALNGQATTAVNQSSVFVIPVKISNNRKHYYWEDTI